MVTATQSHPDDFRLVQEFLDGDVEALGVVRERHHASLCHILIARGASPTEAEDLLANLWDECVPRGGDETSLLEKFSGRCSLHTWLATVATRRLIDFKRRERFKQDVAGSDRSEGPHDYFERLPAPGGRRGEEELVQLLAGCLRQAFARCAPQTVLILRLVYIEGVTQREVGRMFGWHETKVSRLLSEAMKAIEHETLRELRARDPWLHLGWEDFQALCETHQIGFL